MEGTTKLNTLTNIVYILTDVLEELPYEIEECFLCITVSRGEWHIGYTSSNDILRMESRVVATDAAYSLLCWCIENGYVETNKNE